jgi:peptidyl-prolyl cis-trans isomerase C
MSRFVQIFKGPLWLPLLALSLAACSLARQTPTTIAPDATATLAPSGGQNPPGPANSPTPFQPSATPPPLAARVNDAGISLAEFQAELARYKAAVGTELAPQDEKRVLDDLINQTLLAQGAQEDGFVVDDSMLQDRIDQLTSQLGGAQTLSDWMAANGYTEADFRQDLRRSIAAAWKRDQIIASVPQTADQVHIRQILLDSADQADQVLSQLKAGADFANLAAEDDPVTEGDLGWFPRGYLPDPKIEAAAFSLQPDQFSDVIATDTGFHILQVIERDPQRPLTPDARLALQSRALQDWLDQRRSQGDIQVLLP